MTVAKGAEYCGEHGNGERVPCPLDPTHSCFKSVLPKHLSKCNAQQKELRNYIVPQVNTTLVNNSTPGSRLAEITDDQLLSKIDLIRTAYNRLPPCKSHIYQHELVSPSLEAPDCGVKLRKHLVQIGSLLTNIQQAGFLADYVTIVEFGAGRGQLSYWLGEILKERTDCSILLVDRASARHKYDNKLKDTSLTLSRVRADIADLDLSQLVLDKEKVVGVCKHLCGEATDLSLRCLLRAKQLGVRIVGLVMASCCHHRCTWANFIGQEYLLEMGFTEDDFPVLCGITSWATCGSGQPRSPRPTSKTPDGQMHAERYKRLGLGYEEREEIGRMVKFILDHARLRHLEKMGFPGILVYYVSKNVSPENMCLIAKIP